MGYFRAEFSDLLKIEMLIVDLLGVCVYIYVCFVIPNVRFPTEFVLHFRVLLANGTELRLKDLGAKELFISGF